MMAKKRSGRPKKAEHEKVQYQRIAVYTKDYEKLIDKIAKKGVKLTDAFTDMVNKY
jgi:hypothetical protein